MTTPSLYSVVAAFCLFAAASECHLSMETLFWLTQYVWIFATGIALFTYDYAITFGAEVQLFWSLRPTAAAAVFFLNRYLALADTWLQTLLVFAPSFVQVS